MASHVSDEFAKVMLGLAEAYGTKFSEGRIRIYAAALADIPLDVLRQSAMRSVREHQFFPTVAELRKSVEASPDDAALIAWASLEHAAAKIGAWQDIEFEDAIIATSVAHAFGSWPNYCAMEDGPERTMKRQEFLAIYRASRKFGPRKEQDAMLRGLCGADHPLATWRGRVLMDGTVETVKVVPQLTGDQQKALAE